MHLFIGEVRDGAIGWENALQVGNLGNRFPIV